MEWAILYLKGPGRVWHWGLCYHPGKSFAFKLSKKIPPSGLQPSNSCTISYGHIQTAPRCGHIRLTLYKNTHRSRPDWLCLFSHSLMWLFHSRWVPKRRTPTPRSLALAVASHRLATSHKTTAWRGSPFKCPPEPSHPPASLQGDMWPKPSPHKSQESLKQWAGSPSSRLCFVVGIKTVPG